jgi:hypothetical protein
MKNPQLWGSMSVEGIEPSTNGLKGQRLQHAFPIQWPAIFAQSIGQIARLVHWMLLLRSSQRGSVQWISFTTDSKTLKLVNNRTT